MLYDVSSSHVEGRWHPLTNHGYNRDKKNGKMQIVYRLLRPSAAAQQRVAASGGR